MPQLLFSDEKGSIYPHPHLKACGMKAGNFFRLNPRDLIKLPEGSNLFMMPGRCAVGYDPAAGGFAVTQTMAVAASITPGHTATYSSAYRENTRAKTLPLFSYAACAYYKGSYYVTAVKVDKDIRHDCRFIDLKLVRKNIPLFKKALPGNRLVEHLKTCALTYGCPNAQNFFLKRFEAPLPTSPSCNAACAGCISQQKDAAICASQPRIRFVPTPEEVAGIALLHIAHTRNPIVSFGQGCEGEPLLQVGLIEKSICLIRQQTSKGIIHMNTNGSRTKEISRLLSAGLSSVRISLNSAQKKYYTRYYRPGGYAFSDVLRSIATAKKMGAFVSINYLTMPGFTDSKDEFKALHDLVQKYDVNMIQWRNLNYDPIRYFGELDLSVKPAEMAGIKEEIDSLRKNFPRLRMGYFNPYDINSRATASRHR